MNLADRVVSWAFPGVGLERARARRALAYYEAADASRLRKHRTAPGSSNVSVVRGAKTLRERARYFEQNHDLARGILSDLVAKTIGPHGITWEPQPRTVDGEIHDEFAAAISALLKDWEKRPEVTWQHDWASCQRMLCRSWMRDGEVFAQELLGRVPLLDHGTAVPYSLEMLEADLCPLDFQQGAVQQGVELNVWGRPRAYHVYLTPPGDMPLGDLMAAQTKRIPAERMLHIKLVDRIRQIRGVSVFASVLDRFDDLKDYEESERIAAKVAASMAAVIKKGSPETYDPAGDGDQRELKFRPGMIFDDLLPGESIETIDTKRPNANLLSYRTGQLRAASSGTMTSYSSIAKDYSGTYSSQRQELVESWIAYAILGAEFASRIVRPVYESVVRMAVASGQLKVPAGIVPASIDDAIYIAPQMPWIDPQKEEEANVLAEESLHDSAPAIIRRRGGVPHEVLAQQSRWNRMKERMGLETKPREEPAQPQRESA